MYHRHTSRFGSTRMIRDGSCHVRTHIIDPAIKGTLNVLKSCSKTSSIKRVVFTSSISTMTYKDNSGRWVSIVVESCQIPIQRVPETKPSGWVLFHFQMLCYNPFFRYRCTEFDKKIFGRYMYSQSFWQKWQRFNLQMKTASIWYQW